MRVTGFSLAGVALAIGVATAAISQTTVLRPVSAPEKPLVLDAKTLQLARADARKQRRAARAKGTTLRRAGNARPAARPLAKVHKAQFVTASFNPPLMAGGMMTSWSSAMDGWKPLTTGAAGGSPELVQLQGSLFMLVTGGDKMVHSVRINTGTLAAEDQTWTVFSDNPAVPSLGDIDCHDVSDNHDFTDCGMVTTGGAAAEFSAMILDGNLVGDAATNLGGSNAGARPALAYGFVYQPNSKGEMEVYYSQYSDNPFLVWDGASGVFSRKNAYGANWQKGSLVTKSGFACEKECAYLKPNGSFGFAAYVEERTPVPNASQSDVFNNTYATTNYFDQSNTVVPALAGGRAQFDYVEKFGTAYLVQIGSDGALYVNKGETDTTDYETKFGPSWQKLGGWARPGSWPSCALVNSALTCAIQALDGKIYIKRFAGNAAI